MNKLNFLTATSQNKTNYKDLVEFMSHLNNNFPIVLFPVLTFIDNATCVYTSVFVPELQTSTDLPKHFYLGKTQPLQARTFLKPISCHSDLAKEEGF